MVNKDRSHPAKAQLDGDNVDNEAAGSSLPVTEKGWFDNITNCLNCGVSLSPLL